MIVLCKKEECTGCMACKSICPNNAIDVVSDNEGFANPKIDHTLCVECGLCQKVCPELNPSQKIMDIRKQKYYSCWTNNNEKRMKSSSGGLFSELAEWVLHQNGIVFGVTLDHNLEAVHTHIEKSDDLPQLRGSKYVQSKIGDSYKKTKFYLNNDKIVLFSGTPCQIAGLNNFLGKDYPNLFTIDLICHGVPSPLIFEKYKAHIEDKLNSKITSINFRDKRFSWIYYNMKIKVEGGNTYFGNYYKDPWIRVFLRDNILRTSCYSCKYSNLNRPSDITAGDYWGYSDKDKKSIRACEKGVSLAIVNTQKGRQIFNSCSDKLIYNEKNIKDAIGSNMALYKSPPKPKKRDIFWNDLNKLHFNDMIKKWMISDKIPLSIYILCNFKHTSTLMFVIKYIKIVEKILRKIVK